MASSCPVHITPSCPVHITPSCPAHSPACPPPSPAPAFTCHFRRERKSFRWSVLMTFPLASVCEARGQRCPTEPTAGSVEPRCRWHWVAAEAHLEPGMLQGLLRVGSPVNRHHRVRTARAGGLWPAGGKAGGSGCPCCTPAGLCSQPALRHPDAWGVPTLP